MVDMEGTIDARILNHDRVILYADEITDETAMYAAESAERCGEQLVKDTDGNVVLDFFV